MSKFPVFDPASPQAEAIRDLFVQVLGISGGIFAIVAGLICVALWKFRAKDKLPTQDFGSHRKEIAWIVAPVLVAAVLVAAVIVEVVLVEVVLVEVVLVEVLLVEVLLVEPAVGK